MTVCRLLPVIQSHGQASYVVPRGRADYYECVRVDSVPVRIISAWVSIDGDEMKKSGKGNGGKRGC